MNPRALMRMAVGGYVPLVSSEADTAAHTIPQTSPIPQARAYARSATALPRGEHDPDEGGVQECQEDFLCLGQGVARFLRDDHPDGLVVVTQ